MRRRLRNLPHEGYIDALIIVLIFSSLSSFSILAISIFLQLNLIIKILAGIATLSLTIITGILCDTSSPEYCIPKAEYIIERHPEFENHLRPLIIEADFTNDASRLREWFDKHEGFMPGTFYII